jgi:Family of unknown function (DUF5647)
MVRTHAAALPAPPWAESADELDDVARRSIALSFDFSRAIVENPAILDDVPNGAVVVLIPPDDPDLAAREIETGIAWLRQGVDVYFRHVRPGDRSR